MKKNLYYLIDDGIQELFYRRVLSSESDVEDFYKQLAYENLISEVKRKRGVPTKPDIIDVYASNYKSLAEHTAKYTPKNNTPFVKEQVKKTMKKFINEHGFILVNEVGGFCILSDRMKIVKKVKAFDFPSIETMQT